MAGDANHAGEWKVFKSITFSPGADWAMMLLRISSPSARRAIKKRMGKWTHPNALPPVIDNQP